MPSVQLTDLVGTGAVLCRRLVGGLLGGWGPGSDARPSTGCTWLRRQACRRRTAALERARSSRGEVHLYGVGSRSDGHWTDTVIRRSPLTRVLTVSRPAGEGCPDPERKSAGLDGHAGDRHIPRGTVEADLLRASVRQRHHFPNGPVSTRVVALRAGA